MGRRQGSFPCGGSFLRGNGPGGAQFSPVVPVVPVCDRKSTGMVYLIGTFRPFRRPGSQRGGPFQHADSLVGEQLVGAQQHLNLGQPSRGVDDERDDHPTRDPAFQRSFRMADPLLHPRSEGVEIFSLEAGHRLRGEGLRLRFVRRGLFDAVGPVAGSGPFRRNRSLPERVSRRGGQQQQRRAEPSERSHGLAWKTARSSPSERISSIGPSMS